MVCIHDLPSGPSSPNGKPLGEKHVHTFPVSSYEAIRRRDYKMQTVRTTKLVHPDDFPEVLIESTTYAMFRAKSGVKINRFTDEYKRILI